MTRFSLPATQAVNKAAFADADSATRWLAGQPQANAVAMSAELARQLDAFNGFALPPRNRFKTLEVLRKAVAAVSGESQKRFEYRPLPLSPVEQTAFETTRRLWRSCALGYLHCLDACLARDEGIASYGGRVAHRVLACLRMEQQACYLASVEIEGGFWRILHAVWGGIEQLGVARDSVADRLLGESAESTPGGQYAMLLMLSFAQPYALSRGHFASIIRWLGRWREQATVLTVPDDKPKSCCIPLDLSSDKPTCDDRHEVPVAAARWLSVGNVLRKIRQRLDLLAEGQSPESLKLGSGITCEAAVALLKTLGYHLQQARHAEPDQADQSGEATVAIGLENVFYLLGGKGLKDSSFSTLLNREQLAVFDHVVRDSEDRRDSQAESWDVVGQGEGELHLRRVPGSGAARLVLRGLLAIREAEQEDYSLALISRLRQNIDGSLSVSTSLLATEAEPLVAELREKPSGKISRHPALLLPAGDDGAPPAVVVPAGVPARGLSVRFFSSGEQTPFGFRLSENIERGGDNERWTLEREK